MPHFFGGRTYIRMMDSSPGDLVIFSYDNSRAIGIVFEFNDDGAPLIGVLKSAFLIQRLLRCDSNEACVSLGKDWAIEPIESEAAPGHFEVGGRAGLLVLNDRGWLMNFAASYPDTFGRFTSQWRNLKTNSMVERVGRGMVFDEWWLWASSSDRERPGAEPLIRYKAATRDDEAR